MGDSEEECTCRVKELSSVADGLPQIAYDLAYSSESEEAHKMVKVRQVLKLTKQWKNVLRQDLSHGISGLRI